MKLAYALGAGLWALGAGASPAAAQATDEPALQDVIIVTGHRAEAARSDVEIPDARPFEGPDATQLQSRIPGGARLGNGPLSGQAQYRGLFGSRINVRIDEQSFASGGPNLMDPPLHYAPLPLIAALEIDRGVSPVHAGPGLAGGLNAALKRVDFSQSSAFSLSYDLMTQARSVDDSVSGGGVIGAASDAFRFNLMGSYERGGDTEFPGGEIAASRFERGVYGLSAGARFDVHTVSLDLRRQNTGPTGNPPFPMDIRYFDTDFARARYDGTLGAVRIEASVSYSGVAHAMSNFDLRPAPAAMNLRETYAQATTHGADAAAIFPALGGEMRLGGDYQRVNRNVVITNPANANFWITNLPDIETDRVGAYAEWTGALGPVEAELGLRTDRTAAQTGLAQTGAAVPAGPAMLAAMFNAADRSREDDTIDAAARLWTQARGGLSWRLTLARKTRAPSYLERFSWLPTNASAGLADGNVYVGDLDIEPETALIAEAGFDFANARFYARPTLFVRQVDNYIQGVPFDATPGVLDTPQEMVANVNGDATPLQFANVDARLYGFDIDAGARLGDHWRLDAVASFVRGERRDINDNLYRVAPASLTASLTYDAPAWSATVETRLVAKQTEVSQTNSEAPTGGYAIVNVYGDWHIRDGVRLGAGVENIFDERYEEHLGGYNRIAGSDVALGDRLPGPGAGAFVRLIVSN
ncbi:MAG: TonB-dependent receptor [Hyphomonadaceae bacterium]